STRARYWGRRIWRRARRAATARRIRDCRAIDVLERRRGFRNAHAWRPRIAAIERCREAHEPDQLVGVVAAIVPEDAGDDILVDRDDRHEMIESVLRIDRRAIVVDQLRRRPRLSLVRRIREVDLRTSRALVG